MARCSGCGATITEQDRTCPDCGMELGIGVTFVKSRGPGPGAVPTPAPLGAAADWAGQAGAVMATLTLRRGAALTEERFPLGERVTVGRSDVTTGPVEVDLAPLPEAIYLSRRHAEMWRDASGQWLIRDLGSQNGTYVRPAALTQFQRVEQETPIHDGDEVAFGNARFEFRTG
jgi:hypothetical protein